MSLRTRLIVSFFLLSVVPLAAVTFYTYRSNVEALRVAAEREADLLASELSQRMQLVTAQLSERVEHLMDIQELQTALASAEAKPAETAKTTTEPSMMLVTNQVNDQIAKSLGEAAMLLNNVELQGMRFGRGGPPPPGTPPGPGGPPAFPPPPGAPGGPPPSADPNSMRRGGGRGGEGRAEGRGDGRGGGGRPPRPEPPPSTPGKPTTSPIPAPAGVAPPRPTAPAPPPPGTPPQTVSVPLPGPQAGAATAIIQTDEATQRLMIDLGPIRREMFRQIVPEGRPGDLTPEQRQKVADQVNQRMLGIAEGIRLSAQEIQRKAQEAQKAAAAMQAKGAKAGTTGTKGTTGTTGTTSTTGTTGTSTQVLKNGKDAKDTSALKRKTSLSGNRLDVKVERDGQVVRQANAEVNMPNVLATVFSTTHGDRGEVPFAIGKDGKLYTRDDADATRVEQFGAVATAAGPATARLADWIIVTTQDPSGSGLKLGIARPVGDSLSSLRKTAARNAALGLLFIGIAIAGIAPLSTRLTRNLSTLGEAARRIASGDYRTRVPVKGSDEVSQLAVAFNQMAEDVERHQLSAVEQERIKRELELGRQIQNEMLPHAPLRLGLTEIKGVSVPAREVGGDFFNYFQVPGGQVALLVGDVSGKGVGAALLMANIQASLRTRLALGQGLSDLADEIDHDIEDNSPGPVYATLFVGILDPETRRLRYVNAGHHPQYALKKGGGLEKMESTGLPVGLFAGRGHREQVCQLAAGDSIVFYTDGCVEAEDEAGEMFGAERLEALLASLQRDGAEDVLERVESALKAFRGQREPFDDATLMVVKVG